MLIGVVTGMLIFDLPFSFMVFLGLVSLAGIGVNDAIVLMDKTKRNIEEMGMSSIEAVIDAGDTRLQPIMLTTITTIIVVVPLAFANEFWVGLSISIIFGLAFATVLQLFVVPMLFVKFEGSKLDKKRAEADESIIKYQK
jgi:multidrug efflux pump subunit AcrB